MKLLHTIHDISQEASGPSYSVPRLCQSLSYLKHEVTISCISSQKSIDGVSIITNPLFPLFKRLGFLMLFF